MPSSLEDALARRRPQLRRPARDRGRLVLGRRGRAPRGDRRQRRRQDHAVQRDHRRLPGHRGPGALLRRRRDAQPPFERIRAGMRRTYQSSLLFRDLTVRDNLFLAVRGVSRGTASASSARETNRQCRGSARARAPDARRRPAGGLALARPAAPARDRHGARRRAAPDPVRRAGRGPVARRAARAGGAARRRCPRTWASS